MQSSVPSRLPVEQPLLPFNDLTKQAYRGLQWSKNIFGIAHKNVSTRLFSLIWPPQHRHRTTPFPPELVAWLQNRYDGLLEVDWQDAERGVYPASLLFDNPWEDFFRFYPVVWFDLPKIWQRAFTQQHQDFSPEIPTENYPSYYTQNFHHQTNGYLSDESANLYDLQVEILFGGMADAMRRRILAPLKQHLPTAIAQPKILDLACGTGRTLKFLRGTFPNAALYGMDLSPAYLRKAAQSLGQDVGEGPQLIQANAEALPYGDGYFDAVTCVFLFHELPAAVRQTVIDQTFRVVRPGGVFVVCDSIQAIDTPEAQIMMDNFPVTFHEPYYRHYTTDDLVAKMTTAGFTDIQTEQHFMSKYWVVRKPA